MSTVQIPSLPLRTAAPADEAVPQRGWQAVDLVGRYRLGGVRVHAALHDPSMFRAPRRAGPALPGATRPPAPLERAGSRALPPQAFVVIGAGAVRAIRRRDRPTANDNRPRRSALRDAVFLALLFLTVAGAFWSGRLHAAQTIIVVPGPSTARSVVT